MSGDRIRRIIEKVLGEIDPPTAWSPARWRQWADDAEQTAWVVALEVQQEPSAKRSGDLATRYVASRMKRALLDLLKAELDADAAAEPVDENAHLDQYHQVLAADIEGRAKTTRGNREVRYGELRTTLPRFK